MRETLKFPHREGGCSVWCITLNVIHKDVEYPVLSCSLAQEEVLIVLKIYTKSELYPEFLDFWT